MNKEALLPESFTEQQWKSHLRAKVSKPIREELLKYHYKPETFEGYISHLQPTEENLPKDTMFRKEDKGKGHARGIGRETLPHRSRPDELTGRESHSAGSGPSYSAVPPWGPPMDSAKGHKWKGMYSVKCYSSTARGTSQPNAPAEKIEDIRSLSQKTRGPDHSGSWCPGIM